MAEVKHKLTPKQELFCHEYINCNLNATEAYYRVYSTEEKPLSRYYCGRSANRMMHNDVVLARIGELQKELTKQMQIDTGFLVSKALEVYALATKGKREMVYTKDDGFQPTGEIEYDTKGANGALDLIAKVTGLNVQTVRAQVQSEVKAEVKASKLEDIEKQLFEDI